MLVKNRRLSQPSKFATECSCAFKGNFCLRWLFLVDDAEIFVAMNYLLVVQYLLVMQNFKGVALKRTVI